MDIILSKKNCIIVKYTHVYFLKRVEIFLKTGETTRRKLRYEFVVVTKCLVLLITQSLSWALFLITSPLGLVLTAVANKKTRKRVFR